jgi:pimeloyl-ACP methyl ester carboxylesterase
MPGRPAACSRLLALALALIAGAAGAQERMLHLDLARGDARLPLSVTTQPQALATLILLPGGDGGSGKIVDGKPTSGNFLSRSRELFAAGNFNVIVVYRASDLSGLDYGYRIGAVHIGEIQKVIAYAKAELRKPVWLVGTSRGTVSATAATIALGEGDVQGLVLTSSVTGRRTGAIGTQDIGSIKVPTLVVHHRNDACRVCVPAEAARIPAGLTSAPVKKFVLVDGGSDPQGDPCEARHWHGYINYEKETVKLITDWIRNPQG